MEWKIEKDSTCSTRGCRERFMEKKIGFREMVFVASMFFGMLFGAGNLIFPVSMGQILYYGSGSAPAFRCGNGGEQDFQYDRYGKVCGKEIFLLLYNPALPLYRSSFCYSKNGRRTVSGGDCALFAEKRS